MNKYLIELIGTFFLVLTVGLTVLSGKAGDLTPVAIAGALMVMIYAGGHISGGHYNPAVTLGVLLRGKIKAADAVPYWVSQFIGAAAAAFVAQFIVGVNTILLEETTAVNISDVVPVLVAEFLFTFALVFVVLNVATAESTANNSYFGLAIATVVLVGAYSVGWLTGGAFNPAVAVGGAIMRIFPWSHLWVYLVANFLGGIVAAFAFLFVIDESEAG